MASAELQNHPMYSIYASEKMSNELERNLGSPMTVISGSRLALTLASFATVPVATADIYEFAGEITLKIGDTDAGTLNKPAADIILQHSTPSSFGRGEDTVMDESYRKGCEIVAANLHLGGPSLKKFLSGLSTLVSRDLFAKRPVSLRLYKLAVYEPGGHFDWHRDSTHSDTHSATLLLFLQSKWKGGELVLKHGGKKFEINSPLRAVAFYTDTEHKVRPIREGVRFVLQYDVDLDLQGKVEFPESEESDKDEWEVPEVRFTAGRVVYDRYGQKNTSRLSDHGKKLLKFRSQVGTKVDPALIKRFVSEIIEEMLPNRGDALAFSLLHLYRKASILPELLKGVDRELYSALTKAGFEVQLHPVQLKHQWWISEDVGPSWEASAHRVPDATNIKDNWSDNDNSSDSDATNIKDDWSDNDNSSDIKHDWSDNDNSSDIKDDWSDNDNSSDSDSGENSKKRTQSEDAEDAEDVYHLANTSPLIEIYERVQFTGNESTEGIHRYFGGGMFVKRVQSKKQQADE